VKYRYPALGLVSPSVERRAASAGALRADDLQLRVGLAAADPAVQAGRNLFQPRLPPPPPPAKKLEKVELPPPPPPPAADPGPPPKTAEQIAEEAAQAELKQIKLVGVVFRGEKGQAFLVKGDQLYMVHAGGKVGERFLVEAIGADSIQLKDPATRVLGQIPVSGK
jgi:hypothetical protein